MTELHSPRFLARDGDIPEALLRGPNEDLPPEFEGRVKGVRPGPWANLAAELELLEDRSDAGLAPTVHRVLRFDRRTATDPHVWHYGAVFHLRSLVFERWARKDGTIGAERLMGGVRRNAIARLWWMVETLGEDGGASPTQVARALSSTERFKLWLLDFNSFQGRAWLARAVLDRLCSSETTPRDDDVDAYFGALGRISNVQLLDRFHDRPSAVLDLVDEELAVTSGARR